MITYTENLTVPHVSGGGVHNVRLLRPGPRPYGRGAQPVGPVLPQAGHLPSAATAASLEARDRALGAVRELVEAQQRAQVVLIEQVALARRHGANWVEIGQALGVTRQAARQRFGRCLVDATDGSASDRVTPHS